VLAGLSKMLWPPANVAAEVVARKASIGVVLARFAQLP